MSDEMSDETRSPDVESPGPAEADETITLAPEDLGNQRFSITMRGYDVEEVNDFLATVAESYGAVLAMVETLETSQAPSNPYESVGGEVAAVLHSARSAATDLREQAEQDAEELMARAREELERATQVRQESEARAAELLADAQQAAETAEAQIRSSREELEFDRAQVEEERDSLRQAVTSYTRVLTDAVRDATDARAGTRSLLTEVLERLGQLETLEQDLMVRMGGAEKVLGDLSEGTSPEAART